MARVVLPEDVDVRLGQQQPEAEQGQEEMDGPDHAAYGLGGRGKVGRGTARWHRPDYPRAPGVSNASFYSPKSETIRQSGQ
ncbi:hypothetical protein GCM10020220_055540 [Nonomuraea rubra]